MTRDWFRRTTWTAQDETEFYQRLGRARRSSRAQYLRIQAGELADARDPNLLPIALKLLDSVTREYPDDMFVSLVHEQRASCLSKLDRHADAFDAFRESIAAQRLRPTVQTHAYVMFATLAIQLSRFDLYPEAAQLLAEFGGGEVFPADVYRYAACRARIAASLENWNEATQFARRALAAVDAPAPYPRHKGLGVVGSPEPDEYARLVRLAAS
jgi:tetratricopeptide (TPR) repeat protein